MPPKPKLAQAKLSAYFAPRAATGPKPAAPPPPTASSNHSSCGSTNSSNNNNGVERSATAMDQPVQNGKSAAGCIVISLDDEPDETSSQDIPENAASTVNAMEVDNLAEASSGSDSEPRPAGSAQRRRFVRKGCNHDRNEAGGAPTPWDTPRTSSSSSCPEASLVKGPQETEPKVVALRSRRTREGAAEEKEDRAAKRARYVARFAFMESSRIPGAASGSAGPDNGENGGGDEDDDDESGLSTTKKKGGRGGADKWTPLELQVVELKKKHPGMILTVEVGYKYRFFGSDALTASQILNIVAWQDRHFLTASIPTHRLAVHVRRLVRHGHKVGVVQQTETAALKAVGANRSAPFTRALTRVYTAATLIDEHDGDDDDDAAAAGGGDPQTYVLTLLGATASGCGAAVRPGPGDALLAMAAIDPATGDIVHDAFADGPLRGELEARLAVLAPVEILLCGVDAPTDRWVRRYVATRSGLPVRIEVLDHDELAGDGDSTAAALQKLAGVLADEAPELLERMLALPRDVQRCMHALHTYLQQFDLQRVFRAGAALRTFAAAHTFQLSSAALRKLDVLGGDSLYAFLNRTCTPMGARALRGWTARPLMQRRAIRERQAAVAAINRLEAADGVVAPHTAAGGGASAPQPLSGGTAAKVRRAGSAAGTKGGDATPLGALRKHLRRVGDAEKHLLKIHYGRIAPAALFSFLTAFRDLIGAVRAVAAVAAASAPSGSDEHCTEAPLENSNGGAAPGPQSLDNDGVQAPQRDLLSITWTGVLRATDAMAMLDGMRRQAADKGDLTQLWIDDGLDDLRNELHDAVEKLEEEANENASKVGGTVVAVSGIEFLVQVPKAARVPPTWARVSATTKVARYHSPTVVSGIKRRDQLAETLAAESAGVYSAKLRAFSATWGPALADAARLLAQLDALMSLAEVARTAGWTMPKLVDAEGTIRIQGGRHPVLDSRMEYVPNSIELHQNGQRCLLLNGPNMAGKSSLIRMIALVVILAQMGSHVPCESAELGVFDGVYTRMGAHDNLVRGQSTFMVEMLETQAILAHATARSLVILDELGRGTSTHDGTAIAAAVLRHLAEHTRATTLFVTHFPALAGVAKDEVPGAIRCAHMAFLKRIAGDGNGDDGGGGSNGGRASDSGLVFLYTLADGLADRSYGLNVAALAGLPDAVLQVADEKSRAMEAGTLPTRGIHARLAEHVDVARAQIAAAVAAGVWG